MFSPIKIANLRKEGDISVYLLVKNNGSLLLKKNQDLVYARIGMRAPNLLV